MSITFRRADMADIEILVTLRSTFLKEANPSPPDTGLVESIREMFQRHIPAETTIAWLAFDGEKAVSVGSITFWEKLPNRSTPTGKCAYIATMYTQPDYRRSGIASCIFKHLVEEARTRNVSSISLHALPPGAGIYKQAGFNPTTDEMVLNLWDRF